MTGNHVGLVISISGTGGRIHSTIPLAELTKAGKVHEAEMAVAIDRAWCIRDTLHEYARVNLVGADNTQWFHGNEISSRGQEGLILILVDTC